MKKKEFFAFLLLQFVAHLKQQYNSENTILYTKFYLLHFIYCKDLKKHYNRYLAYSGIFDILFYIMF